MNEKQLSGEALAVWNQLSSKQRELIRKDCPFRMDRNSVLRNLRMRGVKIVVLAELSGLSKEYLYRVITFRHGRPLQELGNLKVDIGRLRGAVAALAARVARIEGERPVRETNKPQTKTKTGGKYGREFQGSRE